MNNFRSLTLQSNLFFLKCPGGIFREKHTFAPKQKNAVKPWGRYLSYTSSGDTSRGYFNTKKNFSSPLPLAIASQDVEHVTKIQLNVLSTSDTDFFIKLIYCTWFTNFHKCTRVMALLWWIQVNKQTTIPKKWRCAWLTGPQVRHSIESWALGGDQVAEWLWQKYLTAHSGAECQAEHYKFCSHHQKTLCYLRMLKNTHLRKKGEPLLWRAHPSQMSPLGWQYHSDLPPLQPALSQGQDTRVEEPSPKAYLCFHTHRRATTKPLLPGHTFPKHKMLLPHSGNSPFRVAGWESRKAVNEQGISSCYRNIQQDTAWQLVMSVAQNHKHFELFWYNGKLWEGERKRTG